MNGMSELGPQIRTRVLVREVMNSPVVSASPQDTVRKVANLMAKNNVGSVIVMEGEKPLGMITERDIVLKCVVRNMSPSRTKAKDLVSKPLHTIEAGKDVTEAARLMRKLGVKRLGVTYKDKLVGIISASDLTAITPELFEVISEKTRIMIGEIRKMSGYLVGYCDFCGQWSDYLSESDGKFICDDCSAEHTKE